MKTPIEFDIKKKISNYITSYRHRQWEKYGIIECDIGGRFLQAFTFLIFLSYAISLYWVSISYDEVTADSFALISIGPFLIIVFYLFLLYGLTSPDFNALIKYAEKKNSSLVKDDLIRSNNAIQASIRKVVGGLNFILMLIIEITGIIPGDARLTLNNFLVNYEYLLKTTFTPIIRYGNKKELADIKKHQQEIIILLKKLEFTDYGAWNMGLLRINMDTRHIESLNLESLNLFNEITNLLKDSETRAKIQNIEMMSKNWSRLSVNIFKYIVLALLSASIAKSLGGL